MIDRYYTEYSVFRYGDDLQLEADNMEGSKRATWNFLVGADY